MSIAETAIRRPVFITCLVILMLATGLLFFSRLPVNFFPTVTMPFIRVLTLYPGAGPKEMESLVSKPVEEQVRTIAGVKRVFSFSSEGVSMLFAEFVLEADPVEAEQQMRDKVGLARAQMPKEVEDPLIQRYDYANFPVASMALQGPGTTDDLYAIAENEIKPSLEQVPQVSQVSLFGGSRREVQVRLNRDKLEAYELSVSQIAQAIGMAGQNIPLGKRTDAAHPDREWLFRSLGEFTSLDMIRNVIVKFVGNDIPVRLSEVGEVVDAHRDETSRAFVDGRQSLVVEVNRQSGANTVAVSDGVKRRMERLNRELALKHPGTRLVLIRDGAKPIRASIEDVSESIAIGIVLCVVVVFFFLGNLRSTLITGVALPNSLIGAFILIAAAGFSVNVLTLLALSLAVGLLVDDAIVVRENIFRHIEQGEPPAQAAVQGTHEVMLAVIATTLAIMSVFGPIAFVGGITGKFLREFGLTVCFIMLISLFDALTMGPMLSAKFAGVGESRFWLVRGWSSLIRPVVGGFGRFQAWLAEVYGRLAAWTIRRPVLVLLASTVIFVASSSTIVWLPKTFMPTPDTGEFQLRLEMPPGTNLAAMEREALAVDALLRRQPEVLHTFLVAGREQGDPSRSSIYVRLIPSNQRKLTSSAFKDRIRKDLAAFKHVQIQINDYDELFGGQRPFSLNLMGNDGAQLEKTAKQVLEIVKRHPGFVEADWSHRPGKPEMRLVYDERLTKRLGVSTLMAGAEVRAQIEGVTPAKFRDAGEEYDIRVRLRDPDRDLQRDFGQTLVPNLNYRLVNLSQVARLVPEQGPATISRQNSQRLIEVNSDINPAYGVGDLMDYFKKEVADKGLLPPGVTYAYDSQGEQFEEMSKNMSLAAALAVLFIYLVLASLYESFVTPFSLLLPLPLAVCGALVALWIGGQSLNIYSIIAIIMLLGIATKNSILLIDYTNQLVAQGLALAEALVVAGKRRLRPILMTSMTLVAGTLPVAIGLNEASKQRTSMGWVIIGGVISSTLLTLVVVPAALTLFRGRAAAGQRAAVPVKRKTKRSVTK
ncbi:MAG: efflux RND transporter permease subunit [candidate division FCPU426 bacterium]